MFVSLGGVWFAERAMVWCIFLEEGVLVSEKPCFGEEGYKVVVKLFGVWEGGVEGEI